MGIRTPLQARSPTSIAPRETRNKSLAVPSPVQPEKSESMGSGLPPAIQADSFAVGQTHPIGRPEEGVPAQSAVGFISRRLPPAGSEGPSPSMGQRLLDRDVLSALRKGNVFDFRSPQLSSDDVDQLRKIENAVAKFRRRPPEIAASLLQFELGGKSASEIHAELIGLGFAHHRAPLNGRPQPRVVDRDAGRPVFEKSDGSRTLDPSDPDIVLERTFVREDGRLSPSPDEPDLVVQDLYVHPDGGMVRVKPQGDPSSLLRPEPHASRSVLLEPSAENGCFDVLRDSGWPNEGFKVDDEGNPAPKAPNVAFGMRAPRPPHGQLATRAESYAADFTDALMSAVHINLPHEPISA